MPTKRKRVTRGRKGAITMDTLPFECLLQFAAGWHPPVNEFEVSRSHWLTWREFMADWLAVRDEYMAHESWGINLGDQGEFAERVYQTYGAKGPPARATYDEVKAGIAAAENETVVKMLEGIDVDLRKGG
jgi:hypothetical protein